jgi:flagellar basal body rod protein FlgC
MIENKKEFYGGFGLLIGFAVVLGMIFSPIFKGQNGLQYLDNLYNSISKGSAYYIQTVKKETDTFSGKSVRVVIEMADEARAQQTASLFMKGGALVNVSGTDLKVEGDLSKILANCLADADSMYINDGRTISSKYGYNERQVLFNWWKALKSMDKGLTKQKEFEAAKVISQVVKKAVECSYNYYRIEPQKISDRVGIVTFSLVFYVVYTLWYGFSVMYMFEGWGMKLEH